MIERRNATRYPLHLHTRIVALNHDTVDIPGYTCNLSRNGVLLRCSVDLTVGQQIDYVIDLYPDRHLFLLCKGKVVRWDTLGGSYGSNGSNGSESEPAHAVAITLDEYECVRHVPEYVLSKTPSILQSR